MPVNVRATVRYHNYFSYDTIFHYRYMPNGYALTGQGKPTYNYRKISVLDAGGKEKNKIKK